MKEEGVRQRQVVKQRLLWKRADHKRNHKTTNLYFGQMNDGETFGTTFAAVDSMVCMDVTFDISIICGITFIAGFDAVTNYPLEIQHGSYFTALGFGWLCQFVRVHSGVYNGNGNAYIGFATVFYLRPAHTPRQPFGKRRVFKIYFILPMTFVCSPLIFWGVGGKG